ncbi:hypothetical protein [Streptomyces sp. NPDC006645]|uniref:hypothetical protein n=1 Tax=unclassified Streptomyces TaxID=2593676 RepID=UPI0033B07449
MGVEDDRAHLPAEVRGALGRSVPGSWTRLLGSLATGEADAYSDIDVEWVVPDGAFAGCVASAESVLDRVLTVAEVRQDPDLLHSDRRRVLFVRFERVPLFWRLDLSVRAESVADDVEYDAANPAARAREGEWSRPASALANALGAVKAVARQRPDDARALLRRGFDRIGEPDAVAGAQPRDIARLARASARQDPRLAALAEQVAALAYEHRGRGSGAG